MKTKCNYLFIAVLLLFSCTKEAEITDPSSTNANISVDDITAKTLTLKLVPDQKESLALLDNDNAVLRFEIIPLHMGYACRVQTSDDVQILDNSTYGYPDALGSEVLIGPAENWSDRGSFVLGTSVGHGGQFEGKGEQYLALRIRQDGEYLYGYVLLDNNEGNTCLKVLACGINLTAGNHIYAGQLE